MPLRLKLKRKDVIRIGDILVGIDFDSPDLIVVIDAPRQYKVTRIPQGMNQSLTKLRGVVGIGTKPQLVGANAEPEPAA